MAAFSGLPRQILHDRRRQIDHLDLVERACRQREQWPADAVTLGVLLLPEIAERNHGFGEMEGGGIVQSDQLAQFGKTDAFAMTGDLLEDGERATERLYSAALPILRLVIDIGLARRDQPRDRRLAWTGRLVACLHFGARFHGISLHADGVEFYQAVRARQPHHGCLGPLSQHTTIAIDVQYYEK